MKKFNIKEWQDSQGIKGNFFDVLSESDMIKYKSKDGEAEEMEADSAKMQPDDHPAKQAWLKTQKDGGEKEKVKGADMFKKDDQPGSEDEDDKSGQEMSDEEAYIKELEEDLAELKKELTDMSSDLLRHKEMKYYGDSNYDAEMHQTQKDIKQDLLDDYYKMKHELEDIKKFPSKTN